MLFVFVSTTFVDNEARLIATEHFKTDRMFIQRPTILILGMISLENLTKHVPEALHLNWLMIVQVG